MLSRDPSEWKKWDTNSVPWSEVTWPRRSEEHTSELQSLRHLVCRLLLEKKKKNLYGDKDRGTQIQPTAFSVVAKRSRLLKCRCTRPYSLCARKVFWLSSQWARRSRDVEVLLLTARCILW